MTVLLIARQDLGDRDADLVAMDDDLALGHGLLVGEHGDGVVLGGIELDHRAAAHAQQLVHRDDRAAEHDRDFDFDAVDVRGHVRPMDDRPDPQPDMVSEALTPPPLSSVEWRVSDGLTSYPDAVA